MTVKRYDRYSVATMPLGPFVLATDFEAAVELLSRVMKYPYAAINHGTALNDDIAAFLESQNMQVNHDNINTDLAAGCDVSVTMSDPSQSNPHDGKRQRKKP